MARLVVVLCPQPDGLSMAIVAENERLKRTASKTDGEKPLSELLQV